jgi:hypothetical protein
VKPGGWCRFFDQPALIEQICDLLDSPQERVRLGANARAEAMRTFDLMTVCLPRQMQWVESLADPKGEACPAADL